MKTLLFSLVFLFGTYANAQDTTYSRIYEPLIGSLDYNVPISDAAVVWDDGLITSGITDDQWIPTFLARIAPDGTLMWQKECGGNAVADPLVSFNQLISTRDSNFVIAGVYLEESASKRHPFCMKLNADGDTLWTKSFFLSNQSVGSFQDVRKDNGKLIETSDSMLLVGFHHSSFSQSPADPDHLCLSKFTMNGDVEWSKSFITDSAFLLRGIAQAADSSIYIVGQSGDAVSYSHLLNVSADGQLNWARKYEGIQFEDLELDSTNLYITWTFSDFEMGLLKLDLNGDHVRRVQYYTGTGGLRGINSSRRSNGNIVSAPMEYGFDWPGGFVELDENLDLVALYEAQMLMNEVISIPNKGIYALGFGPLYGIETGNIELGVVRFDSVMNTASCVWHGTTTVTVRDSVPNLSAVFLDSDSLSFVPTNLTYQDIDFVSEVGCVTFLGSLEENVGTWNETVSPNPSTGAFTISWNEFRDAEVVIYNSVGMEIYRTNTKNSFLEVDLRSESEGLFYYQLLDTDGSQSSGKLVLSK